MPSSQGAQRQDGPAGGHQESSCECLSAERLSPVGPLRRRGEVEVQLLLLGEADELPVVAEGAAVAVAEVLEDDLANAAEAGRHLEQLGGLAVEAVVVGGESAPALGQVRVLGEQAPRSGTCPASTCCT